MWALGGDGLDPRALTAILISTTSIILLLYSIIRIFIHSANTPELPYGGPGSEPLERKEVGETDAVKKEIRRQVLLRRAGKGCVGPASWIHRPGGHVAPVLQRVHWL